MLCMVIIIVPLLMQYIKCLLTTFVHFSFTNLLPAQYWDGPSHFVSMPMPLNLQCLLMLYIVAILVSEEANFE